MARKEINYDEIPLYTTLIFIFDDITVTIKNLNIDELSLFTDKAEILDQFINIQWYMYGLYDDLLAFGLNCTILAKTKKKIDLMVKR